MDVLFRNEYTKSEEWVRECVEYAFTKRPIMKAMYVVMGLSCVYGLYKLIALHRIDLALFCLPLIWAVVVAVLLRRNINIGIKRQKELQTLDSTVVTEVTENGFIQKHANGAEYRVAFTSIKKVAQTAHYILLLSDAKVIYTLKKDGFTTGMMEEFFDLLTSKGI